MNDAYQIINNETNEILFNPDSFSVNRQDMFIFVYVPFRKISKQYVAENGHSIMLTHGNFKYEFKYTIRANRGYLLGFSY